ncbi:MAG: ATP-binding protein [Nigerium sp.]|nr:ATP-binding protein [Nigerium sp.]
MSPAIAALTALVFGVVIGAVAGAVLASRRATPPAPDPLPERRKLLDALRSAAFLVGEVDDVVAANAPAADLGVVRGDRVALPALLDMVRDVRRTGEDAAVNLVQVRPGRPALQLAVRVLKLADGTVVALVDDRAAALRVLESARDFMANATHELKTPIGAITLLAEAAEQATDEPDAVARFARSIQHESARLADVVAQIVQLSLVQGGQIGRPDEVEVDDVVAEALDRCRVAASQRSVSLTASGTTGLVVRGARESLVTALVNLVDNAIAYSDAAARVVVSVRRVRDEGADQVAIAVTDNGIGIAREDQERVFERFYRVDYARSRRTGGTGLGLAIAREIAEAHGGGVTVWSKPGAGSTFTISLPRAAENGDET